MGVSQGGMIAQYLAIDYPNLVNKLVLDVTLSKQNGTVQKVVSSMIEIAKHEDYKTLMMDTAEKSYSEKYLKKHRFLYSILGRVGKPKDFSRFLIQANSCISHNAYHELDKIEGPTLIIGRIRTRGLRFIKTEKENNIKPVNTDVYRLFALVIRCKNNF